MLTFDLSSENLLSILGAAFDIMGAVLLAWALVFVRARAIIRQSSSGYGFTPTLVRMFSEQRVDATFGLGLLLIGFFIQGAAGYGYKSTNFAVLWIGVAILVAALTAYRVVRERWTRRIFNAACKSVIEPGRPSPYSDLEIEGFWKIASDR